MVNVTKLFVAAIVAGTAPGAASAQVPTDIEWTLYKPTNTGVPGESVQMSTFGPDGKLWVAARWPFFGEGGIGIYDFATDTWETYANWDSPIPSQFISDIEFAEDGAAWIGTGNGLVRFKNGAFTVYDSSNTPMAADGIGAVEIDSQGIIWVNTEVAVWRFDGETWEDYRVGAEIPWELPWDDLSGLAIDANGNVYVGSEIYFGAAKFDGTSWTIVAEDSGRMRDLEIDTEGNLWAVAGIGGGNQFWKFDGENVSTFTPANTPFANTTITNIEIDDNGDVFVSNWNGSFIKTTNGGANWQLMGQVTGQAFTMALPKDSDDIWVTSPGWVNHFTPAGQWVEAFNTYNTGLPDNFIDGFTLDENGNFWIASAEAGFSRFDGERWKNLGHRNPNEPWEPLADGAEAVFADQNGKLWVGTNGIAMLDPITGPVEGDNLTLWDWRNSNLGVSSFESITVGVDGIVHAADGFYGVDSLINGTWVKHLFGPAGFTSNYIESLDTDAQGNTWAISGFELHRYDGAVWTTFDELTNALFSLSLNVVKAGPDGAIWLGTDGGLVKYDGVGLTVYNTSNSPLPADQVQSIAFREDGLMAISAHEFGPITPFPNGVAFIDGDIENDTNWTVFTFENSPMRHYQLGDVAFDAHGDLWINTISEGVAIAHTGGSAGVCFGDCDNSGAVDFNDLVSMLFQFGGTDDGACNADGSGRIDFNDLVAALFLFGPCA